MPKSISWTLIAILQVPPPQGTMAGFPPGPPPQGTARMAANISRFKLDANEATVGISSQTQLLPNLREYRHDEERATQLPSRVTVAQANRVSRRGVDE